MHVRPHHYSVYIRLMIFHLKLHKMDLTTEGQRFFNFAELAEFFFPSLLLLLCHLASGTHFFLGSGTH